MDRVSTQAVYPLTNIKQENRHRQQQYRRLPILQLMIFLQLAQSLFQVGGNAGSAIGPLLAAFVVLR